MRAARNVAIAAGLLACAVAGDATADGFSYLPPGDLINGSGEGRVDSTVFAPGMRFVLEKTPAFANSQVYMAGGMNGPPGGQCADDNYAYPWRDNYCEVRSWDMPLCPAGTGHQGQDIRPASCDKDTWWAVATTDGTITHIGSYSVYLTAADGTRYDYLHMSTVQVSVGQDVSRGDKLGYVSNAFGGTPTTIHLHFNIRQHVDGLGSVYVPPYMSLVKAYEQLVDAPPTGYLETVDCEQLVGWAFDPEAAEAPATVKLTFDDGDEQSRLADRYRGDLCENLGFCEHGFAVGSPLSLFDGSNRTVRAFGSDGTTDAELIGSPLPMDCPPLELSGWRRPVSSVAMDGWAFSTFWDLAYTESSMVVEALPVGDELGPEPSLLVDEDGELWLHDGLVVRAVSEAAAEAWRFDAGAAATVTSDELHAIGVGEELSPRPVLVRDADGALYLVDSHGQDEGGGGAFPEQVAFDGDGDGCSCRTPGGTSGTPAAWLLALLPLWWRRRGRRATVIG